MADDSAVTPSRFPEVATARPAPAPMPSPHAQPTVPEAWPALWRSVIDARGASQDERIGVLVWRDDRGWWPDAPLDAASAGLFALYKPLLDARREARRCVVAQLGISLDGCVATHEGDSYFVSGPESLVHLHRLRALADAVLVGAGTVAADDPQLTTRRVPGSQPVRVVLDPAARLDGRSRVLRDGQAPTLWLCDERHADVARSLADRRCCEVVPVDGLLDGAGRWTAGRALDVLAARGLKQVFVEGGGVTVSRLVAEGRIDHLHLIVAPVLTGTGRPGLQLPPQARMRDCPRPPAQVLPLGQDVLWSLDLRGFGAWTTEGVQPAAEAPVAQRA